ncbi:unannotated protein [freshwater metagenome]|uniref:Unannotated protein n=1 Tax=freshwater metagenome TaxID=449393 RepID=A0A6J7VE26_9ZZZZ
MKVGINPFRSVPYGTVRVTVWADSLIDPITGGDNPTNEKAVNAALAGEITKLVCTVAPSASVAVMKMVACPLDPANVNVVVALVADVAAVDNAVTRLGLSVVVANCHCDCVVASSDKVVTAVYPAPAALAGDVGATVTTGAVLERGTTVYTNPLTA